MSRIGLSRIGLSRIGLSRIGAAQGQRGKAPSGHRGHDAGGLAHVEQGGEHRIAGLGQVGEDGPRDALPVKGGDHFTTPSHRPRA